MKPDAEVWCTLGFALLHRDFDEAKRCFQKALDLEPANPRALYNLACTYSIAGDVEKSLEFLRKTIAVDPDPAHLKKQMAEDHDFDSIRNDPRFQVLIK